MYRKISDRYIGFEGVELQPNIRSNVGKVTQFDQISRNQYRLVPDSASPVLV